MIALQPENMTDPGSFLAHQGLALPIRPGHYSRQLFTLTMQHTDTRSLPNINAMLSALFTAEEDLYGEMARLAYLGDCGLFHRDAAFPPGNDHQGSHTRAPGPQSNSRHCRL